MQIFISQARFSACISATDFQKLTITTVFYENEISSII